MKEVMISINKRAFTIDLALEDEELIEVIFKALAEYVENGFSIKVRQSYVTSLSDSLKIILRIISGTAQMSQWRAETRQLISVIRKGE